MTNPALAPFDLTGYSGTRGWNFYSQTSSFVHLMNRYGADLAAGHLDAIHKHLTEYGALCGGVLNDLIEACHKEGKYGEIVPYDATGNRIDEVRYSHEQREARRICFEHGIVNLGYHSDWKFPFSFHHRMMLAFMTNMNGEGGVACPLAMTDGLILVLEKIGTEEQKRKYLPILARQGSGSHFMAGQYVTERVGGSNVAANRTVARKASNGSWILNGEKWFCSNPGDLWVTTARIENSSTIGLFLVSRIKDDGTLNGCRLVRKKDIIGSKGKITVETIYEDVEATELGRPAHGLANLIKYVINTSRLHVSAGAVGHGRRSYLEVRAYTQKRTAYGKKIIELPAVLRTLARMQVLQTVVEFAVMRNYDLNAKDHVLSKMLTPLLKYASTVLATHLTHEGILVLGGNGILGDFSILPRLHNDAIINETWEGTHPLLCEHALKAYGRPNVHNAFKEMLSEAARNVGSLPLAARAQALISSRINDCEKQSDFWVDSHRTEFCDLLYAAFSLSEMIQDSAGSQAFRPHTEAYAELLIEKYSGETLNGFFSDPSQMAAIL